MCWKLGTPGAALLRKEQWSGKEPEPLDSYLALCRVCIHITLCNPLSNSVRGEGYHLADEEISSKL